MEKTVLIDTNLYLDDAKIIYKLSKEYDKILIPITILKELDQKKFDKNLSYSARNAIRAILDFMSEYKDKVKFDTERYEQCNSPDVKILASAKKFVAAIATKDISMSISAKALGLESTLHDMVLNNIFKPYLYIKTEDLYAATSEDTFSYQPKYVDKDYHEIVEVFSRIAGRDMGKDVWWFAIIFTGEEKQVIYANNPLTYELERIDDKPNYREIRVNEGTNIKARDCYQVCAIYALEKAPHVLITGRWGSGKSLLSAGYAINRSKKKTFITRAPIGINSKYDVGYLPGDLSDKYMDWLQGFTSALYYLYGNTKNTLDGNGQTYDFVREELFHRKFQIMPMNSIQGLSLLDNDTLIVDEAQLIDVSYMSMILSRPSGTGKLILLGDLKQTYDVVKPSESGLLKLLRVLPHKHMAYIELQNSYRSPLLEVADKLQDRTINI